MRKSFNRLNVPKSIKTAAAFLGHRTGDAKPVDLLPFLDKAGTELPPAGDEMPV